MNFYTNVDTLGDSVLIRERVDGKDNRLSLDYNPTLFVTDNSGTTAKYKNLNGEPLKPVEVGSIREMRTFSQTYAGVGNFQVYGGIQAHYQYINGNYPKDMEWNIDDINIVTIDIETTCEFGFPNIEEANEEINAITIKYRGGKIFTYGCGEYKNTDKNVTYVKCETEYALLENFLDQWCLDYPDVITGWNCIPVNSNIWKSGSISPLSKLNVGDVLLDSIIKNKSPENHKTVYNIKTSNGITIKSSKDHIFPFVRLEKGKYSSLQFGKKELAVRDELKVEQMVECMENNSIFLELKYDVNENKDLNISDECLYALGAIYTDGSIQGNEVSFYNNDDSMINYVKAFFDSQKRVSRKGKGGIWESKTKPGQKRIRSYLTEYNEMTKHIHYIHDGEKKNLNIEELSKLSKRQFEIFFAACLDGDGCISNNELSFCNYNGDIDKFSELLRWNGYVVGSSETNLRFYGNFNFIKYKEISKHSKKVELAAWLILSTPKDTCSDDIKYRIVDESTILVRVSDIYTTQDDVAMMDIETDTNYFVYSGIKTHNCRFFDIPYIVNRMNRLWGHSKTKRLSPWNYIKKDNVEAMGRVQSVYNIVGVSSLDYLELYRKFTYTAQESYKLDHIAFVELDQRKLSYSEYSGLHELYKNDYQKFIEYNIKDVILVDQLEEKMKLIELAITLAYEARANYPDVFMQVRMWDVIIYNYLKDQDIIIPNKEENFTEHTIAGGFVKEPQLGRHDWVVSFDLNSLYPHLIMEYNVSPETLIDKSRYPALQEMGSFVVDDLLNQKIDLSMLKQGNMTMAANGEFFTREHRGFLPTLMDSMYTDRSNYKKLMISSQKEMEKLKASPKHDKKEERRLRNQISKYKNLQMAKKILLNSAYGACANKYFRFFDNRLAEGITLSGQLSIKWIEKRFNVFLNKILKTDGVDYVVAVDTDSCYLNLAEVVKKFVPSGDKAKIVDFIDKFCQEIMEPEINKSYQELADYVNAYEQKMQMSREVITNKAIWVAKKRYILDVIDSEGVRYAEPELKIQGIEAVRSSTPNACRQKIKDGLKIIMRASEDELIDFVQAFKNEFMEMDLIDIAFPRGVNGLEKYECGINICKKGTPIHARGSLYYNHFIKEYGIGDKYQKISSGDKIKFLFLKEPNHLKSHVISFPDIMPTQFNIDDFVDRNKQFEKTFIAPLAIILEQIGWNYEKKISLMDFMK